MLNNLLCSIRASLVPTLLLSVALLGSSACPGFAQTAMEFAYPAPFHRLHAPSKRLFVELGAASALAKTGLRQDLDKVPSGVWLKDELINPQKHPDFKQLVMSGAGLEGCALEIGTWVFAPGAGFSGETRLGVDHDAEIICSCNAPEHSAAMILPEGAKSAGLVHIFWGEQYIFGDYEARSVLHNGAYQLVYPSARMYGDTEIQYMGESNMLGRLEPGASINVLDGGLLRVEGKAQLEGRLFVDGGLAMLYEAARLREARVENSGTIYTIASWLDDDPMIENLEVAGGRAELEVGEVGSLTATDGLITFKEHGRLVRSPGARVKGTFSLNTGSRLQLWGDVTPLALDSPESILLVDDAEISLAAWAWQTEVILRDLRGKGKIEFGYSLDPSNLVDQPANLQNDTPMPIARLIIMDGGGEFELTFKPGIRVKRGEAFVQRELPPEFVLVEDYSEGEINFLYPEQVEIEECAFYIIEQGEYPKLLVLTAQTAKPEATPHLELTGAPGEETGASGPGGPEASGGNVAEPGSETAPESAAVSVPESGNPSAE